MFENNQITSRQGINTVTYRNDITREELQQHGFYSTLKDKATGKMTSYSFDPRNNPFDRCYALSKVTLNCTNFIEPGFKNLYYALKKSDKVQARSIAKELFGYITTRIDLAESFNHFSRYLVSQKMETSNSNQVTYEIIPDPKEFCDELINNGGNINLIQSLPRSVFLLAAEFDDIAQYNNGATENDKKAIKKDQELTKLNRTLMLGVTMSAQEYEDNISRKENVQGMPERGSIGDRILNLYIATVDVPGIQEIFEQAKRKLLSVKRQKEMLAR